MYKFKFQTDNPYDFYPPKELVFSCIVPESWLAMDLPTIHGCVNYAAHRDELAMRGPIVMEFGEVMSAGGASKTISLDIIAQGAKCFERPAVIHCTNFVGSDAGGVERVLLSHLMGWCATSTWFSIDMADFMALMKKSVNYEFRYGIGKTLSEILPGLLDCAANQEWMSEFFMIFGANQKMHLKDLDRTVETMFSESAADSLKLVGAAGVEEEQMLISAMLGHK